MPPLLALTIDQVATDLEWSASKVSRIETGQRRAILQGQRCTRRAHDVVTAPFADRITVALLRKAGAVFQRLRDRTALSKTDLANRAITLYEFIAQQSHARQALAGHRQAGTQIARTPNRPHGSCLFKNVTVCSRWSKARNLTIWPWQQTRIYEAAAADPDRNNRSKCAATGQVGRLILPGPDATKMPRGQ